MHSKEFLLDLYRTLYAIRVFESECVGLYRQGLIQGYFHPYLGEEAIAAGVCRALDKNDYIVSTHRGHGHSIARGAELRRMAAELMGRETGYCLGLGGSMHIADVEAGNLGANGIVGGGIAIGVGAALGAKIRKENRVSAIFFSDGASNNGIFPESLNLAAVLNLPVIFVCENNHYAVSTPVEKSCRSSDLYRIGQGYSIDSMAVDGNDVLAVFDAAQDAVAKCRAGKGPIMLEAKTYRYGGHHVNDPGAYMPKERLEYFKSRDPVAIGKDFAIYTGKASGIEIAEINADVEKKVGEAIAFAKQSPDMPIERFLRLIESY
jgi:pyruvate dehydrogenase E1 component alpha subunit